MGVNEDLVQRAQRGDQQARDALILRNRRLVYHLANRLRHVGVDLDDLISAGTVGLLKAADSHDAARGKFVTHAWWKIRSELSAVIAAQRRANRTKLMSGENLDRMPW